MFSRSVARLIIARPSPASAVRALATSASSPSAGAPSRFLAPAAKHNQLIQRAFSNSAALAHGGKGRPKKGEGITLHFKKSNGEIETVEANEGDDIVDVSWEWDLDIEAACEKSIACSTCHVILEDDIYDKLEEPSDDENDMLDLAFGLTDTSRLGCQVKVTKEMDGTTITLPSATRNLRVDGSKPTPH
ncbi:2Fe-2S ferredoxin-type domain-containing protein [Leucosporidium creatinivorum]|uniref:2Fe-2S ferredoxin-type domain-containing protein n=1 Tax=Leucosporidium creatinivorum TaxID=106004 RepID=A0A1Y2D7U8_9BASI|nr:2Fe-2S ferredoxin-type domain-containing protein [Leucosporidium creatinivorum]